LQAIKSIFQWMARQNHLLHNPASEIVLPRMEHQLPKYVHTADEAEQIIQQRIQDPEGLRESAVLETFYSTGLRRMELAHLKLYDIDNDLHHADRLPGQGAEGPRDSDRRAGAGVDQQVSRRVAPVS
jgi:site-specific recombinase XerD